MVDFVDVVVVVVAEFACCALPQVDVAVDAAGHDVVAVAAFVGVDLAPWTTLHEQFVGDGIAVVAAVVVVAVAAELQMALNAVEDAAVVVAVVRVVALV